MRWSEFAAKECVDIVHGEKLGSLSHADLSFDPRTGEVEAVYVPVGAKWYSKKRGEMKLAWRMIRKVGPEMVIVEAKAHRI
jgi:YlmC/YmxH family sporulation protein